MDKSFERTGRTRCAILGVLSFRDSTGYEIRKLLSETTAHFWKESYGQIYPALEILQSEERIAVSARSEGGRGSVRYRILPAGLGELKSWIRSPDYLMKPGRYELLLKLFFARKEDAAFLIPQLNAYLDEMLSAAGAYDAFAEENEREELPIDAQRLIGTTIDYGRSAAEMQITWCRRTLEVLEEL